MSELHYCTDKKAAINPPRRECSFFGENKHTYECTALTQCYCVLEDKPCPFYKPRGAAERAAYAAAHGAINIKTANAPKVLPREVVDRAIYEHETLGLSYEAIAKKYNVCRKLLDKSRRYYGHAMEKPRRRTEIPEDKIQYIIKAKEAGRSWQSIAKSVDYSVSVIQARLKERGIIL